MSAKEVAQIMLDNLEGMDFPHVRNQVYKEEKMAGCHNPGLNETLALCEHDVPVKYGCLACHAAENEKEKSSVEWDMMYKTTENLSKRILELEAHITKLHDMINMEDRITASDVLLRLHQLETNVDFEKAKELIYQGAQTHASILKCEAKYVELDGFIMATRGQFSELHRAQEKALNDIHTDVYVLEEQMSELKSPTKTKGKKPYACPVCKGTSFCKEGMDCKACDGSCLVWG